MPIRRCLARNSAKRSGDVTNCPVRARGSLDDPQLSRSSLRCGSSEPRVRGAEVTVGPGGRRAAVDWLGGQLPPLYPARHQYLSAQVPLTDDRGTFVAAFRPST